MEADGIRFNLFVQSFSQLNEKYGDNTAQNILDNCYVWNYLKTSNLEEIEQYSIQRQFILDFVDELINEICKNYDTIWEKFKQKLHISKSQKAIDKLKNI